MPVSELFTAEILTFLAHAAKKDEAKGGVGVRTTREIAEHIGTNVALLRRRLAELSERGLIDEFERDSHGTPWRITEAGRATLPCQ